MEFNYNFQKLGEGLYKFVIANGLVIKESFKPAAYCEKARL